MFFYRDLEQRLGQGELVGSDVRSKQNDAAPVLSIALVLRGERQLGWDSHGRILPFSPFFVQLAFRRLRAGSAEISVSVAVIRSRSG
jgi:hypothetical protein